MQVGDTREVRRSARGVAAARHRRRFSRPGGGSAPFIELPTFGGSVMVARAARAGRDQHHRHAAGQIRLVLDQQELADSPRTAPACTTTSSRSTAFRTRRPKAARRAWASFRRPAAVAEFKVQTAPFDASAGHTVGSVVNVSTKSGTNQLHGRRSGRSATRAFDAPNIFQNRAGQRHRRTTRTTAGASWPAGRCWLPKVYNGKNRTFWFYGYRRQQVRRAADLHQHRSHRGDAPRRSLRPARARPAVPGLRSDHDRGDRGRPLPAQPIRRQYHSHQPAGPGGAEDPRLLAAAQPAGQSRRHQQLLLHAVGKEETWDHLGRVDHAFNPEPPRLRPHAHGLLGREQEPHLPRHTRPSGSFSTGTTRASAFDDVYVFNPTFLFNFRYGLEFGDFLERRNSRGFDLSHARLLAAAHQPDRQEPRDVPQRAGRQR